MLAMLPQTRGSAVLFRRVLVAVDGSPGSRNAVRFGISLAAGDTRTELAFCHAIDVDRLLTIAERTFDDLPFTLEHARDAGEEILAESVAEATSAGCTASSFLVDARPAEGIDAIAERFGADVVIVGGSAHRRLRRLWKRSTRDAVLATAKRPILVVP